MAKVTGDDLTVLATALFHWRQKLVKRVDPEDVRYIDLHHACYLLAASKGIDIEI